MNKELEKIHVNGFASAYENFPSGKIIPSETPDFIINTKNGKLGIELTQIFKDEESHGSSLQAQEKQRLKLIQQTKVIYENNNKAPISVYFKFNIDQIITNSNISELAQYLAKTLISTNFSSNKTTRINFFEQCSPQQEIVHSLIVKRKPVIGESNFSQLVWDGN
jgi:hypothetical protein